MRLMSWAALAVPTFAIAALVAAPAAAEKPEKGAKGGAAGKKIALSPEGLKFGMAFEEVDGDLRVARSGAITDGTGIPGESA